MYQNLFSAQSPLILATTSGSLNTASTGVQLPLGGPTVLLEAPPANTGVVVVKFDTVSTVTATTPSGTPSFQVAITPGAIKAYSLPYNGVPFYYSTISPVASQQLYISVGDAV